MTSAIIGGTGPAGKAIHLETSKARQVDNWQNTEIDVTERNQHAATLKRHPNARIRRALSATYNCHGLTFASRRTGIYSGGAIAMIMDDDSYEVLEFDDILPGDIIVYYSDPPDVEIEHTGIVAYMPDRGVGVPLIVSKWGRGAEAVHAANDCPYNYAAARYFRCHI